MRLKRFLLYIYWFVLCVSEIIIEGSIIYWFYVHDDTASFILDILIIGLGKQYTGFSEYKKRIFNLSQGL